MAKLKKIPRIEDLRVAVEAKKRAYLDWLSRVEIQREINIKKKLQKVKRICQQTQRDHWEKFISRIEHDVHGHQSLAFKVIEHLDANERDAAKIQVLEQNNWLEYYKDLWFTE